MSRVDKVQLQKKHLVQYSFFPSFTYKITFSLSLCWNILENAFKPFVSNAPFLYPLKTSENLTIFWCFQGIERECIGNEWVNMFAWLTVLTKLTTLHYNRSQMSVFNQPLLTYTYVVLKLSVLLSVINRLC